MRNVANGFGHQLFGGIPHHLAQLAINFHVPPRVRVDLSLTYAGELKHGPVFFFPLTQGRLSYLEVMNVRHGAKPT